MKKIVLFFNNRKEWVAVIPFSLIGLFSWFFLVNNFKESLPLFLFYIVLVINTFFCVRLFSKVIPTNNITQNIFDFLLVISYFITALSMASEKLFIFFSLILFIIATAKYVFLIGLVEQPKLLRKKLAIDLSGVMALSLASGGILFGYSNIGWATFIVFGIANVLFLLIWPMYRLD